MFDAIAENGQAVQGVGSVAIYLALVFIYFWFGGMKFTAYEAKGSVPLVSNSPVLSWMYGISSERGFATFLGCLEISVGLLIAARLLPPALSVIGGLLSLGLFAVTVSFMFSTPGVVEPNLGFPAIAVEVGQFLLKDIGLLAALFGSSASRWLQSMPCRGASNLVAAPAFLCLFHPLAGRKARL